MALKITFGENSEIDALRIRPCEVTRKHLAHRIDGVEQCQTLKSRDPHTEELTRFVSRPQSGA